LIIMEKKPHKKPTKQEAEIAEKPGFKGIVRIAGKDVSGYKKLNRALLAVRGIGFTMGSAVANVIKSELAIDGEKIVGEMTDEEIEKVDKILFSIQNYNVPKFLLNRRGDIIDGLTKHYIMNDLIFAVKQDVEREKRIYSWKGYRHSYGQKVRGQRTRNTGRSGMAVGVLRKSIIAAQKGGAGAEAAAKGGGAPAAGKPAAAAAAGAAKPSAAAPAAKPAGGAAKPAEKK